MDYAGIGFFLGATPGFFLALRSMWWIRSFQKGVESIAWKERDWNSTQLNQIQQLQVFSASASYIAENESPSIVAAKRALLAAMPTYKFKLLISFLAACLGAFPGAIIGQSYGV